MQPYSAMKTNALCRMNSLSLVKSLALFTGCLFLLTSFSSSWAAERTVIDWKNFTANEAPPAQIGDVGVIRIKGDIQLKVVDSSTDPASPFSDGKAGLYVQLPKNEENRMSLTVVPFSVAPLQGWVEMELLPFGEDDNVFISLGSSAPQPADVLVSPVYKGTNLGRFVLRPQRPAMVLPNSSPNDKILLTPPDQAGRPAVLRVAWDFSADQPEVKFYLNGEVMITQDGEPYILPVNKESITSGIDYIHIAPNTGFIGRVTASE